MTLRPLLRPPGQLPHLFLRVHDHQRDRQLGDRALIRASRLNPTSARTQKQTTYAAHISTELVSRGSILHAGTLRVSFVQIADFVLRSYSHHTAVTISGGRS